jgi:hypothetical protein
MLGNYSLPWSGERYPVPKCISVSGAARVGSFSHSEYRSPDDQASRVEPSETTLCDICAICALYARSLVDDILDEMAFVPSKSGVPGADTACPAPVPPDIVKHVCYTHSMSFCIPLVYAYL